MSAIRNTKLCWNCEGEIHVHSQKCPHCGIYAGFLDGSKEDSLSLQGGARHHSSDEYGSIPKPPYSMDSLEGGLSITEEEWNGVSENEEGDKMGDFIKNNDGFIVSSLLFLNLGVIFFLFSIFLFLFSYNGIFTLRWNGNYWPLYLFISFVSFFYGFRKLCRIDEAD